jgi:hypothetical protein
MSSTNDNTKGGSGSSSKDNKKSGSSKKTVKFADKADQIPDKEYSQKYHPDVKKKSAKSSEKKKA